MRYVWDFSVVFRNFELLLHGLYGTLRITGAALTFALPIALVVATMRLTKTPALKIPAVAFTEVFRSTPALVQLFWAFYALPILIGVRLGAYETAVGVLSLQSASFFAEVFRGGIVSIERGQWEAGRALGMTYSHLMRRVILPQAIKRMIPAFLERAIELVKTTSLVSTIAFADLLYQAIVLSQVTFRPLEIFTVVALMYFVVIFSGSMCVRALEARLARAHA